MALTEKICLSRLTKFFQFHQAPKEQRITIASFHWTSTRLVLVAAKQQLNLILAKSLTIFTITFGIFQFGDPKVALFKLPNKFQCPIINLNLIIIQSNHGITLQRTFKLFYLRP